VKPRAFLLWGEKLKRTQASDFKILLLGLFMLPAQAGAWGAVGHKTVAVIAEDHLTKTARREVQAVLGREKTLESVSTWADSILRSRPETAPWHYLNLDARQDQNLFDLSETCKDHQCVVDQINREVETLKAPFVSRREKREALSFLVHFVADLHQPLHCVDDHDRGGNEKWFRYHENNGKNRRFTWVNFHAFWDHLLEPDKVEDPWELATRLEKGIHPTEALDWSRGQARDWAYESFLIARNDIYKDLPEGKLLERNRWGKDLPEVYYSSKMRLIVDRQLEKAGIRLAYLLNGIFPESK
jgi:hypothetical protein